MRKHHHHNILADINRAQFLFLKGGVGSAASQYSQQPGDLFRAVLGLLVCGLDELLSAHPPFLAGSSLAAAGRQTVVQRIAEGLGGLQDLRAARREGFLRPLPEQLQPGLPAHLGDAGSAYLPPAAHPRLGWDGQAAWVDHPAGGGTAGLQALKGYRMG